MEMTREIDDYFMQKKEPVKSCLAALRHIILHLNSNITEVWRYKMPFYCYKGESGVEKRFCYLWIDKKTNQPYIGIVEGKYFQDPDLITEKRSKMKIMLIDPDQDLPLEKIKAILEQAIEISYSLTRKRL